MDKAVNYVLNRRETAETYLEDGRCSFTNNLSENAIRPFAVGRKNWLFSDSVDGANVSAVVYTMVEMAKAHDLNIYGYLKFLLEHRPTKEMTDDQLAELAPWSEKLQSIKNQVRCSCPLMEEKKRIKAIRELYLNRSKLDDQLFIYDGDVGIGPGEGTGLQVLTEQRRMNAREKIVRDYLSGLNH